MTNCSSDLSYMHDEFVELLWENGPWTSSRPKRSSIYIDLKDCKDKLYPKIGHFRLTDSKINNFPISGINNNVQEDEIVPWINYPMEDEDPLHDLINDYPIHSRNIVPTIRSGSLDQPIKNSHKLTEIDSNISGSGTSKAHKESNGVGVMNFSHFSRPVALAKANLESINNKADFATSCNPMESTLIESNSNVKSVLGTQDHISLIQLKPLQEVALIDKANDICERDISKKDSNHNVNDAFSRSPERIQSSSFMSSVAIKRNESEKGNETAVASSSACSGSNAWGKRKIHDGEESGYQSEDVEVGSVDLKKPVATQGKSKKRSRAAEVHNLSERRRRDRINERMRALQELIPNCNKTDKASMLDEAIEYLKSLQMQVQIMSMNSGLCMPPMMMQHLRAPMMAHYSPMGIGLNYGMGLYDMNSSQRCSFIPVSPIQGPHFPCPSIQGTVRPNNFNMFGMQGPLPCRPPIASMVDTKTAPVQQSDNFDKMRSSDSGDMQS